MKNRKKKGKGRQESKKEEVSIYTSGKEKGVERETVWNKERGLKNVCVRKGKG